MNRPLAIVLLALAAPQAPANAIMSNAELHTFHCLHGCPIGAPAIDDVVVREIYTLASNDLTKMADWVAYRVTPQGAGVNQAPWPRLEAQENALATREDVAVYVLTGPLFERVLPPMPGADERHRVPSGYWKVVATSDGRLAAFIMDTAASRSLNHCDTRVGLDEVELRSRLGFFPRLNKRSFGDLSVSLNCPS